MGSNNHINGAENLNLLQFPATGSQSERQEMLILKEKHQKSFKGFLTLLKAARRAYFDINLHHHLVSKAVLCYKIHHNVYQPGYEDPKS